jgi:hypothetical protein
VISLATRPVLFTLARALGEAWPDDVPRDALVAPAFGSKFVDESHRARLRVEMGRLRRMLRHVVRGPRPCASLDDPAVPAFTTTLLLPAPLPVD